MPTTNGHAVTPGLVLDSHFGWHNHARMIATAVELGYELDVAGQRDVDAYDTGEYTDDTGALAEIVHDIMDDAERWLNEHTPLCCFHCGQPVEWNDAGSWVSHTSLDDQHACGVRMADGCKRYLWHWSDGDFFLSPMCDDDDCDDDTCAHWSFQ